MKAPESLIKPVLYNSQTIDSKNPGSGSRSAMIKNVGSESALKLMRIRKTGHKEDKGILRK